MKGSDVIADFLEEQKVEHVFGVTGGCIVHTLDSISNKKIKLIPVQHEQAGAIAADAYARVKDDLGVMLATSGPGATNLLTGTCCSYYDSIPVLNITGQVGKGELKGKSESRQIGFQETGVVDIYRTVTKYADLVDKSEDLRYKLEKAAHLAKSGRKGPVLLDICDDVQQSQVDMSSLRRYEPPKEDRSSGDLEELIQKSLPLISQAQRPVVILGGGIRLAGAIKESKEFVESLGFPVVPTWAAMDYLPANHYLSISPFGITPHRAGNFAVQNSDLVIAIGTRLDTHETGPKLEAFARGAKKIVVDIDQSELDKYGPRGMHVDVPIRADVRDFLSAASKQLSGLKKQDLSEWREYISTMKKEFPIILPEYRKRDSQVDPYVFMEAFNRESKGDEVIIPDCGGNLIWTMQGIALKGDQRLFSALNHSPMGYTIPATVGAAFATDRPIIGITGDGGMQMNIQELATIAHYNLPVKIFLMNNHGHGIIKQTLRTRVSGKYVAVDDKSGLGLPDLRKVTEAYGIPTLGIENHRELNSTIRKALDHKGPVLCDVDIPSDHEMSPKLASKRPYIEDSYPFLPDEEFYKGMRFVKPVSR